MKTKLLQNCAILSIGISVLFFSFSCTEKKDRVMTVNGWTNAEEMGITLPHEHIMVDFIGADSTGYHRWDKDSVIGVVLPYLQEIAGLGCKTFIECTPAYLGRDPVIAKNLSQRSGMNIIVNTGYYGAVNNKYLPEHAFSETSEQLAERWLKEWNEGIEDSGIRPGFIKIAVRGDTILSDLHKKIVTAAALTHLKSGLTITSHTGPGEGAFEQLEILKNMGVSPESFVWTHAQAGSQEDHIRAAREGAWVSLDNVSSDTAGIEAYVLMLGNLKKNELLHKTLLSHDAGWYSVGQPGGADFRPYTAVFTSLIPALKEAGFTEEDISMLMEKNPQAAYTIKIRRI